MTLKHRIAARLDRRYARTTDVLKVRTALSTLEARVRDELAPQVEQGAGPLTSVPSASDAALLREIATEMGTLSARLESLTERLAQVEARLGAQVTAQGRDVREVRRLADESVVSINALMETEMRHRLLLDTLTGDGA